MANNVSFNGGYYGYSAKDIENLAKYATGVAITNKSDISATEVLSYPLIPTGLKAFTWLKENRKDLKGGFNVLKQDALAMQNVRKANGFKGVFASTGASELIGLMPAAEKMSTYSKATQDMFVSAQKAAELAKGGSTEALKKANKLFHEANAAAYAEKAASSTGLWGKTKNALGITKLGKGVNNLAVKSPAFGKAKNAFKAQGGGMMLAIEGGMEVITNVIPTFKNLGSKAGMKQIGKSAVKTVASVGGWVAGAAVGTKIGAAIGSIIPGAGTAIGAVVGGAIGGICSLICGSLASRLAKKGAEKVVGKDEMVLAQEKQAEELAQQAQQDSTVLNQVANVAAERLEAEGTETRDSQIAFKSLGNVSSTTTNPFASQTAQSLYINQPSYMEKDFYATTAGLA